jgi:hypothetical protein
MKEEFISWETAAEFWLNWMIGDAPLDLQSARGAVASLRRHRDVLLHEFRDHTIGDWHAPATSPAYLFKPLARVAYPMAAKAAGRSQGQFAVEMVELAARKQHDYGTGNIDQGGWVGIVVNTSNKVERLDNLTGGARVPKTDSVADAWADVVGYSMIGCMKHADHFNLPLSYV